MRSVAGQVFVLQVVIILLLVVAAGVEVFVQAREDATSEARNRSLAVAQTFANSPGIVAAMQSAHPTALLQPRAEATRLATGVDFVVVTDDHGIRYTHPIPNRIGKKFVGDIGPALAGQTVTETIHGTIGPLVQAIVPVFDSHHKVIGAVSAGITINQISSTSQRRLPVVLAAGGIALALATFGTWLVVRRLRRQTHGLGPVEMTRMYEHHDAVLHAVREGVIIIGDGGRVLLANDEACRLLELPLGDHDGRLVTDLGLDQRLTDLLAGGQAVTDEVVSAGERLLVVNVRTTEGAGGPTGVVATLRDSTELRVLSGKADQARKRLKLLYEASAAIGTTLDVTRTAEELTGAVVPRFADFASVDLAESLLHGDEPVPSQVVDLRRTALHGIRPDSPLFPVGTSIPVAPGTPHARALDGHPVLDADLTAPQSHWRRTRPAWADRLVGQGIHSLITVPLLARGTLLGVAHFYRTATHEAFDSDDLSLAEELAARAAVCIDNARRFTREHGLAVTLQHSLLPGGLPEQSALDVAYRYLPAHAGVGGDWFDVIPLPGARVALVVGDVVGHGLHAAATMGRLRTAVHNFSTLDVPPDELLGHLDVLVNQIDLDRAATDGEMSITGATCLYAIYDPVSRTCTMARAGHLPPAVVRPDGSVDFPDLPAGPPLGLVGLPFETTEVEVPEGSRLVLYTDGLVEDRTRDIDVGLDRLRATLARSPGTPEETCQAVLDALLPAHPTDDIALLVARTRVLPADRVATWEFPPDPAAVAPVRAQVTERLTAWGLDDLAFATELIISELVTNAIRYATGPFRVRLLCDRVLTCEVCDGSSTSPHLRYAATTDEGGRGLFLVAQLSERWGTRYSPDGKVIWAEQALP
ncbi:PAS domain-containing protein [Streptacidiphilus jiangxiensis]|uniref:PAS domain-containing protein n=2 Tax=Streptacidiphilus jiangxiensis TaxID=235985 RepID=A0A1H7ULH8_STRJI|nr:SpoIIE family protein phosphatase [Streptacidiphilus jiangxiensis]SEL97932.1 PAS domain-containing protein [Streptacidiphilus jiangxiensis]